MRFILREEVLRRQRVFRKLLKAFAFPGTVELIENDCIFSILDCILDKNVTYYTEDPYIKEICTKIGAIEVSIDRAEFVISTVNIIDKIARICIGSPQYPDKGATLIRIVDSLDRGLSLRLRGPGIKGETVISIKGLDLREIEEISRINKMYPLGIDLLLIDRDCRILAIPRFVTLEIG